MQGGLKSARWLKNHGLSLAYENGRGRRAWRFVRPGEPVTVKVAALVLRTNEMRLYRLHGAGKLKLQPGSPGAGRMVPWRELVRLKSEGL